MGNRRCTAFVGVLALVLLAAPACVSKKLFRSNIEDTDTRITSVESAVEANSRKVSDLKDETDRKLTAVKTDTDKALQLGNQALSEAEAAKKAAAGKLLWSVTLTDDKVKFVSGQAKLTADGIAALDQLVQQVKGYGKALYVELEGHTDSVGGDNFNLTLGQKRAEAVRNYLNQNGGLPLHVMNTVSFGEERPVADNTSQAGRAQNRRVVIRVLE